MKVTSVNNAGSFSWVITGIILPEMKPTSGGWWGRTQMVLVLWGTVFMALGFCSTNVRDSALQTADTHSSESEGWKVHDHGSW